MSAAAGCWCCRFCLRCRAYWPSVVNLASRFPPAAENLQFALIFNLIPHALAPLAALLYATGIIQDEVEEQTLTYLLLRPLAAMGDLSDQAAGDAA